MNRPGGVEAPVTVPLSTPPRSGARQLLTWLGLLVVVGAVVVGSNAFSLRDHLLGTATPAPALPEASRVAGDLSQTSDSGKATSLRSSPWWQDVTTLDGDGGVTTREITIDPAALQWRLTATCNAGHITVRSPKQAKPIVDASCPQGGIGYATGAATTTLSITGDGAWHLAVAQQLDVPLVEPPLAAMTAEGADVASTGAFYNIDKTGIGTIVVYHQSDGQYSVRLNDFFVSPNTELELRLSPVAAPKSSADFESAPSALIAAMDVTAGSMNFVVPVGIDPTKYGSVVVWCRAVRSAYAAATLDPAR